MSGTFTRSFALIQLAAFLIWPLQAYPGSLAAAPLFLSAHEDPNVMFALSVEFPTAETAAYNDLAGSDPAGLCPGRDASDPNVGYIPNFSTNPTVSQSQDNTAGICYFETQTYVGYFDPAKCYQYDQFNGWFYPAAMANPANHECSAAWSGNLLNWATMTSLDEFRWAMTGGNRDVDTAGSGTTPAATVIERSTKQRGPNQVNFAIKRLTLASSSVGGVTVPGVQTSKVLPTAHDLANVYFGNWGTDTVMWTTSPVLVGGLPDSATLGAQIAALVKAQGSGTIGTMNAMGSVHIRVKVCDAGSALGLEDNCGAYANSASGATSYKPIGLIQQFSGSMRFAAMSYLYDKQPVHGGGVLRANMKYVGPISKDPVAGTTSNANAEWTADGVFVQNPNPADATASGIACGGALGCSGVVNYLNQFGYTANDYMGYDEVAELYYEALRYFVVPQNGPTGIYAISPPWFPGGVPAAAKDGFPVLTKWKDPIQSACQANVIVTLGDANNYDDTSLPGTSLLPVPGNLAHNNPAVTGSTETWAGTLPNVTAWTNFIGGAEPVLGYPGGLGSTYGGFDDATYYIAGLAWWAHTHDIRSDALTQPQSLGQQFVDSYFIDVREPFGWGAPTGTPGPTQYWLAAKYGGFNHGIAPGSSATGPGATPLPLLPTTLSATSDNWSSNGVMPTNYFYANQPALLVNNLNTIFGKIGAGMGSQASLTASSTTLQAGDKVFADAASSSDWSGDLYAYDVSSSGSVSTSYKDAANLLPNFKQRVLFTFNDGTGAAVPFAWASLSSAEKAQLNTAVGGGTDALGPARLDYLRGDGSNEGYGAHQFRPRTRTKLGDIVDSAPVYVGSTRPDGSSRPAVVYVGANDGMLHAFSAGAPTDTTTTPGTTLMQELFAFVPSVLIGALNQLTAPGYTHRFYVDGSPQVAEASIAGIARTVLAGGLRAGGRAYYALDVTDPDVLAKSETNAAQALLWQFSSSDDNDLGYTFSDPQIVLTGALDASGNRRWAVIAGNGYNNTGSGQAALYVLFLDHPLGAPWVQGSDYVKLMTSVAGASSSAPNGMSTPAVVSQGSTGYATTVYAGDLLGNLWKFDLGSSAPANWKSALDTTATATHPLYTAKMPGTGAIATASQPITTQPEVVANPNGGFMVLFGTGAALDKTDLASTALQTFYGIWDNNAASTIPSRDSSASTLVQQQILGTAAVINSDHTTSVYRVVSGNPVDLASSHGWYLDLRDAPGASPSGERLINNPVVAGGHLDFTTTIPNSANTCAGGGSGWTLALDVFTGSTLSHAVFDINRDGLFGTLDQLTLGTVQYFAAGVQSSVGVASAGVRLTSLAQCGSFDCAQLLQSGTTGSTSSLLENNGNAWQRLAWREIRDG